MVLPCSPHLLEVGISLIIGESTNIDLPIVSVPDVEEEEVGETEGLEVNVDFHSQGDKAPQALKSTGTIVYTTPGIPRLMRIKTPSGC
jgi:hypothetical protein